MDGTQILTLGLGLEAPWILKDQHLGLSDPAQVALRDMTGSENAVF